VLPDYLTSHITCFNKVRRPSGTHRKSYGEGLSETEGDGFGEGATATAPHPQEATVFQPFQGL
jgi:hypothetical protein